MNIEQQEIYDEGYRAYNSGISEHNNPYTGLEAEFYSDGYEDAKEDAEQAERRSRGSE
ncbi:hypothetical protein AB4455_10225 [Vibrio sp. 10N.261.46.E12]|mgnify:CR=1 FL=1|uniref:hypothetical protein n=1 Tax=unclassified Vibrio TaxID=2614977 RepID=UPI0013F60023|nr:MULTISPECIES: hypothetical protein [unclassified Vibrio]